MGKAKFAYAIWPWGVEKMEQFDKAIREISEIGFRYFESIHDTIDLFKGDAAAMLERCGEKGLAPASFYFHLKGDRKSDIENPLRKFEFMQRAGVSRMSLQALWVGDRVATPEEVRYSLDAASLLAKEAKKYGVSLCAHPHCNTAMMYGNEIDFILENSDPDEVFFCPDTAHLVGGRCDPVKVISRYASRVRFTHMKDIRGDRVKSEGMTAGVEVYSNFTELGRGSVDFPAVFKVLDDVGYDGCFTCELDVAKVSNKESAGVCYDYLKAHYTEG